MATITERALAMLNDGMTIGLGTGRAASTFIEALGPRVRAGLKVQGVATSRASADLAGQYGIPLTTLEKAPILDLAFDGADEVDPQLNLIKGFGGALVREKIVAASAKQFIVLVNSDKLVPSLGQRGKVPVEIVPFGLALCRARLQELGFRVELRQQGEKTFVSDNGNLILDCHRGDWSQLAQLERKIESIPGVIDTGLFLDMAHLVLVQDGEEVIEKKRAAS